MKLQVFVVEHWTEFNCLVTVGYKAKDINELFDSTKRWPKRARNWETITFLNENNEFVVIRKHFMEEYEWTLQETIDDYILGTEEIDKLKEINFIANWNLNNYSLDLENGLQKK